MGFLGRPNEVQTHSSEDKIISLSFFYILQGYTGCILTSKVI